VIPISEIKNGFEKMAGLSDLAVKSIQFVKKHPVLTAGAVVGVPATVVALNHMLFPLMALNQRAQIQTSEAQFREAREQSQLLKDIASSLEQQKQMSNQTGQRRKIEPLA
jgi:hypothetical protein